MHFTRLQLNAAKIEIMWCVSLRQQDKLPVTPLSVGSDSVTPVRCVHDLGIFIHSDVSMRTHVSKTVAKCFASLRRLRSIQRLVNQPVMLSMVTALTTTLLDNGGATLAGIPGHLMNRLHSVLNAAVRLVYKAWKHNHVTCSGCGSLNASNLTVHSSLPLPT